MLCCIVPGVSNEPIVAIMCGNFPGNVAGSVGGALVEHLFGVNCDQKLTVEQFRDFHIKLNTEMLKMEVQYVRERNGTASV